MAQSMNQYEMTPEVGDLDLLFPGGVLTGQVDPSYGGARITPGTPVKMVDKGGRHVPNITALTANTDKTFAVVVRNLKDADFGAGDYLELANNRSVIRMLSGAAVLAGANVEVVASSGKVITAAGTNPTLGQAIDKATATDQIIRVMINAPVN